MMGSGLQPRGLKVSTKQGIKTMQNQTTKHAQLTMPKIGITEAGIMHTDADAEFDLDTKFKMVKESGVYDYLDKTPALELESTYAKLSEKYDLPILAGGWFYMLGKDEALLKQNLELGARLGSKVHNTQVYWRHNDGHSVSNQEVADFYLQATEWGENCGCIPTFEVHILMWSEDFRRILEVADLVEKRGVPFRMTLDHSHVIFKIDNMDELAMFNLDDAITKGDLILDPSKPGNVCQQWIERDLIWHCHARSTIPNNPKNSRVNGTNGKPGRGVQYPFIEPEPGQYEASWRAEALDPWKSVVRSMLAHHRTGPNHLGQISTEFIPSPDYGGGYGYSIWENSKACARWIKEAWLNPGA
jgi:hypothetical protein